MFRCNGLALVTMFLGSPELVRAVFIISLVLSGCWFMNVAVDDMPDLGDLNDNRYNGGSRLMVCAEREGCGRCCCFCRCCPRLSASAYGDSGVSGGSNCFCCRVFCFISMGCIKILFR